MEQSQEQWQTRSPVFGFKMTATRSSTTFASVLGTYVPGPSNSHSSPALRPSISRMALRSNAVLGANTLRGKMSLPRSTSVKEKRRKTKKNFPAQASFNLPRGGCRVPVFQARQISLENAHLWAPGAKSAGTCATAIIHITPPHFEILPPPKFDSLDLAQNSSLNCRKPSHFEKQNWVKAEATSILQNIFAFAFGKIFPQPWARVSLRVGQVQGEG